jgi:hypothetical protein
MFRARPFQTHTALPALTVTMQVLHVLSKCSLLPLHADFAAVRSVHASNHWCVFQFKEVCTGLV